MSNTPPKKNKNITRYTYENTDFQGWRVSIQRCGRIVTRYFSDLQYGSERISYAEALEYRDQIISAIKQHPEDTENYMDEEIAQIQQLLKHKENFMTISRRNHP